jgi:hypothetical protein
MSDVARLHSLFAAACFGPEDSFDASALRRYELDEEDAKALAPSVHRLGLYRRLVRHNVLNVIGLMLPLSRTRLEAHAPGVFDASVDAFLASRGPLTVHLRDVPREFLTWVTAAWREDSRVPAYLVDAAEHELVEFTMGTAVRPAVPTDLVDVQADRALVFGGPLTVLHLAWAVHEMAYDDLASLPEARPAALLVYRDAEYQIRFLELSPFGAALVELLRSGCVLSAAIAQACATCNETLDASALARGARLLADLGERGVLLGAR